MEKPTGFKIPYCYDAEKHHLPVLQSGARFKTIIWHRKARKTTMAINELMRWAAVKQCTLWYLSPYYRQTKQIVWDDPTMLPKYIPPNWQKNNSELTITAPNGSKIYFLGADNPDALRGPNPFGVIFDEMDDIKMDVWEQVVRPVLAMNGGWAWFLGTPKGQGNLYKFFHKQDPDWQSFMLKASESGLFKPEELEAAKRELPQAIYNQEFETEFIQGGSNVFRRVQENLIEDKWYFEEGRRYKVGVDLAKLNDWTVFTPVDLHNWHIGKQERFNQVDYPLVEAKLEAYWRRYGKALITVDSTGIGEPVCDHLERNGIPIERFTFTEDSRMQLLENFAVFLEQDRIRITTDGNEQLIRELNAMRYEFAKGERKKLKIISPISDDCVMSAALAFNGLYAPQPLALSTGRGNQMARPHTKTNPFR